MKLTEYLDNLATMYGKPITQGAAQIFLESLSNFSEEQVLNALKRCAVELKYFPTPSEVITRIDTGYLDVEEAWAAIPKSESESTMMNQIMNIAYSACASLMNEDKIAARQTFKEVYSRELMNAKIKNIKPNWFFSAGSDSSHREKVIRDALRKNIIGIDYAKKLLPSIESNKNNDNKLLEDIVKNTFRAVTFGGNK